MAKKLNGTVIVTYRCNARCTMCNRYKCPSKPEEEISIETIKKYGMGFAPNSWSALKSYMLSEGFTEEELEQGSLISRSQKNGLIFHCGVFGEVHGEKKSVF